VAEWVAPSGALTVVLQLPSMNAPPAAETPFESLKPLRSHMHLVPPSDFSSLAKRCGLSEVHASRTEAPHGKAFYIGHFSRDYPSGSTSADPAWPNRFRNRAGIRVSARPALRGWQEAGVGPYLRSPGSGPTGRQRWRLVRDATRLVVCRGLKARA
jgi:hypothetical protein